MEYMIPVFRLIPRIARDGFNGRKGTRSVPACIPTQSMGMSASEKILVRKQRRGAAGVQEDDVLVIAPTPLADHCDQAGEPFA